MQKLIATFLAAICFHMAAFTQQDAVLKKAFPEAEAVYTELLCQVNISQDKEGKINVTSNYSEDLMYLTDNAVNMLSRGRIYHSTFNKLNNWEAYTQLPGNNKLKVANTTTNSSTQNYIFYDDTKSTSFDFAGGKAGANRHIEYQIQHSDAHLLSPHYFDRYFPIVKGELKISFPSNMQLKYVIKGVQADKVSFSETKKRDRTTYTFKVENYSGISSYPDAPDEAYYATHIVFFITGFEKDGKLQSFLSSPEDLYRYNYNFIRNINKEPSTELKSITDSLVRTANSEREKADRIYRWVQKNIKYVAFEDGMEGFIPREANLVCSRKYGDCKDMASILTAMLKHAGLQAYFTWIGTRDLPYTYHETPLPIVDNHMICAVKLGNEYIFLDGTDEGCIFGLPPYSIQGKQALVGIGENDFKILQVPTIDKTKNTLIDSTFLVIDGKHLKGKIKILLNGYWASSFYSATHYRNQKENETYLKQRFQRANNKLKFTNWAYDISPDRTLATVTADIELPDFARFAGNEIFMNLNLFKFYEHKEIDFPKRKSPIENPFLEQVFYTTVLKLPDGHQLTFMPKSNSYKNEVWGYTMAYKQEGNNVILSQQFDNDHLLLNPAQFEQWNKVLENLYQHYKQTIVITKN